MLRGETQIWEDWPILDARNPRSLSHNYSYPTWYEHVPNIGDKINYAPGCMEGKVARGVISPPTHPV